MAELADRLDDQEDSQEEMARVLEFQKPKQRFYIVPDLEQPYSPLLLPLPKKMPSPEEIPEGHKIIVKCFHQIFRRDGSVRVNEEYGFCNQCIFDPDNNGTV